ncbi:type-1 angiotensin II receptor-associated protein isoform X6 [Sus scrofa]|uniref:type-1 angiotensin II receptor-associated protein isoform X6 n=1 Tax=Sus scrofa TaxID=9823 RepID=UPI000A2B18EF|nr:type-1 angiotensin II receptor-associated protein isoform X6 [Sus scrofa]
MELPAVNLKGLHCVPGPLCLGQLHHPGLGRVGRGAAGLRRRHKYGFLVPSQERSAYQTIDSEVPADLESRPQGPQGY